MPNRSPDPGLKARRRPWLAPYAVWPSGARRSWPAAVLAAALAGLLILGLWPAGGRSAYRVLSAPVFPCQTQAGRAVAPLALAPGQQTTVTVRIDVSCEVSAWPRRLVLVVDASTAMSADGLQRLKNGLAEGVATLAPYLRKGQGLAVAVLPYDGRGVMAGDLRFSQDQRQIQDRLGRIVLSQQTCGAAPPTDCGASAALRQAAQLLEAERLASPDAAPLEFVLLASAGIDAADLPACGALKQSAASLRDRPGAPRVMAACASEGLAYCGYRCLDDVSGDEAEDNDFQFFSRSAAWWNFPSTFGALGEGTRWFHPLRRIEFYDRVPDSLDFAGGDPPSDINGEMRTWWSFPVESHFTFEKVYQLEPQLCSETGVLPSSDDAAYTLEYVTRLWGGTMYSNPLDMPLLRVPCVVPSLTPATPTATATGTGFVPSSTPTPTPSATPTAPISATPSPTAVVTRVPRRVFLPQLLLRDSGRVCPQGPRDAVLLLDVSTSMRRGLHGPDLPPFGAARRLEVAQRLGGAVLDSLSPAVDRAALVEYGRDTFVSDGGLVACCGPARAALAQPHSQSYTFPWEGLARAVAVFDAAEAPADLPRRVMVLITDLAASDLSPADQDLTLAAAQTARRRGIELLALGIGPKADRDFLQALVGGRAARVVLSRDLQSAPEEAMAGWMACQP